MMGFYIELANRLKILNKKVELLEKQNELLICKNVLLGDTINDLETERRRLQNIINDCVL